MTGFRIGPFKRVEKRYTEIVSVEVEPRRDVPAIPAGPLFVWNDQCGKGKANAPPIVKRLVDANGLGWEKVMWCNVETGELERFLTDENGNLLCEDVHPWEPVTEKVKTAAPLRIEWGEW